MKELNLCELSDNELMANAVLLQGKLDRLEAEAERRTLERQAKEHAKLEAEMTDIFLVINI